MKILLVLVGAIICALFITVLVLVAVYVLLPIKAIRVACKWFYDKLFTEEETRVEWDEEKQLLTLKKVKVNL